jgi:hypothetical protein
MGIATARASMKIDNQITSLAKKPTSAEPRFDALFEDWLDTPSTKKNGDDYYWQHQNQLQQSALMFSSVNKQEASKRDNREVLPDQDNRTAIKNSVFVSPAMITPIPKPVDTPSPSLASLISLAEPQITGLKETHEPTTMSSDSKIINKMDAKNNSIEFIIRQILPKNSIFKNHQLFINNNEVELTLNTSQLSKEETHQLQKFMKQWLNQKGYALTKLIINGVLQ